MEIINALIMAKAKKLITETMPVETGASPIADAVRLTWNMWIKTDGRTSRNDPLDVGAAIDLMMVSVLNILIHNQKTCYPGMTPIWIVESMSFGIVPGIG